MGFVAVTIVEVPCAFCDKFARGEGKSWYDEELYRDENFVIVPALGPFAPGYLMLVTIDHHRAFAELSNHMRERASRLTRAVRRSLENEYGLDVIVFEHGGSSDSPAGSCIDHAHLHFMPAVGSAAREIIAALGLGPALLHVLAGAPYVFVIDNAGNGFGGAVGALPGQYVRRVIAEAMGFRDEWDYLAFPRLEVVRATIEAMSKHRNEWQRVHR